MIIICILKCSYFIEMFILNITCSYYILFFLLEYKTLLVNIIKSYLIYRSNRHDLRMLTKTKIELIPTMTMAKRFIFIPNISKLFRKDFSFLILKKNKFKLCSNCNQIRTYLYNINNVYLSQLQPINLLT